VTRVSVTPTDDPRRFDVQVADGDAVTSHIVTVPQALLDEIGVSEADTEDLVRESFEFLLERERPSQILREFSLDEIGRYFPEYPSEIAARLSAG
jgi:hypothetical protein